MRLRFKLLLLLLGISLVPLLVLRMMNQNSVYEMGEEIARRARAMIIHRSSVQLQQRVADHAFVMSREHQLLELALQTQAIALKEFLEGEDPQHLQDSTNTAKLNPEQQAQRHCRLQNDGTCPPEALSYETFAFMDNQMQHAPELENLVPFFQDLAASFQDLILWQYIALPGYFSDGSPLAVYPATNLRATPQNVFGMGRGWEMRFNATSQMGGMMGRESMGGMQGMMGRNRRSAPHGVPGVPGMEEEQDKLLPAWHRRAVEAKEIVWSLPELDPLTGRLVIFVSMPILSQNGEILGTTALVVLVDSLLHTQRHDAAFATQQETMVVYPVDQEESQTSEGAAQLPREKGDNRASLVEEQPEGPALRVLARALGEAQSKEAKKQNNTHMMHTPRWQAPHTSRWISSRDTPGISKMVAAMLAEKTGVVEMPYKGRPSLWAYGPIDTDGVSLLIIAPKAELTAEADSTRQYILDQFQQAIIYSGLVVSVVICIIIVLALIMARRFTHRIEDLAQGFKYMAEGDFTVRVPVTSSDEIGQLASGFNAMVPVLEERFQLRQSLDVAHEIQRSLLPHILPQMQHFALAGSCVYSETTGGDYFDVICPYSSGSCEREPDDQDAQKLEPESLGLAVGDVTGHGLPAAMLMTTTRAFIRQRASMPGGPGEVLADVNRQLYNDVDQTGRFMTLFYAVLHPTKRSLRWARAGHDPALLFNPDTESFTELAGEGLPLGTMREWTFEEQEITLSKGQLLCIGTDGVWEATNPAGEMFGKERLKELLRRNAASSPDEILQVVLNELRLFMGEGKISKHVKDGDANIFQDDVTLLLLKAL